MRMRYRGLHTPNGASRATVTEVIPDTSVDLVTDEIEIQLHAVGDYRRATIRMDRATATAFAAVLTDLAIYNRHTVHLHRIER
ncbi:MAG: hypothetical protein RJB55_1326 [Verrucomicrobiota bacterium]